LQLNNKCHLKAQYHRTIKYTVNTLSHKHTHLLSHIKLCEKKLYELFLILGNEILLCKQQIKVFYSEPDSAVTEVKGIEKKVLGKTTEHTMKWCQKRWKKQKRKES